MPQLRPQMRDRNHNQTQNQNQRNKEFLYTLVQYYHVDYDDYVDYDILLKELDIFMEEGGTKYRVTACLFGINEETLHRDIGIFLYTGEMNNDPMFSVYMDCNSDVAVYMLDGDY